MNSKSPEHANPAASEAAAATLSYLHDPKLRPTMLDGMAHATMIGAGENYLSAFAVFLNASNVSVGVLASLPPFIGALCQLLGAWVMEYAKSRKKMLVLGATTQAVLWIPIAALPFLFSNPADSIPFLVALVVLYYCCAGFLNPIWSSLIGDLVPGNARGRYFGTRNMAIGLLTFVGVVLGGGILQLSQIVHFPALGYALTFTIALFARLTSSHWLSRYSDPPFAPLAEQRFSFIDFIRRAPYSNFAQFVLFVALMNFSALLCGPYFTVYVLRDMHKSFLEFSFISGGTVVMQFLAMRYWGPLTDKFGSKKILTLCGYGIGFVPLGWLVSANTIYLFFVQTYAGFVWAGFNLAAGNFMFDAVTPQKRMRCVAYQAVITGVFVLLGALSGGQIANILPNSIHLSGLVINIVSPLSILFVISSAMRFLTAYALIRRFDEVRPVEPIEHKEMIFLITALRPLAGATFSLIGGLLGEEEEEEDKEKEV